MNLSNEGLQDRAAWERQGVRLPRFDRDAMRAATEQAPVWVHFGAGNIFRGFIAVLQQRLLNDGLATCGILAADTFDYDIIDRIYSPHDCMSLMVSLQPDGGTQKEVIASIAQGIRADSGDASEWAKLVSLFENPALQMVSFTITEKGYALADAEGKYFAVVCDDMDNGPVSPRHAMGVVAALMLARYRAGAYPVALVSMDNCSHNGEKLRNSVLDIARNWGARGFVEQGFLDFLEDERRVSFPWSMIDKITPRPADIVCRELDGLGIEGMEPLVTRGNTYIAPFVNAEIPEYLVVEDRFPNGRPPLEKAGVYMTDRETVNKAERMKVTTCLNPLHTALAVYGCLLGYDSIAAEMHDRELKALVERIGYDEGIPVVTDPGIFSPAGFIREVIEERLPNPFIPDTPQRIATDTSQKVPVRFGETIKAYLSRPDLDIAVLTGVPLALAGWLRYLLCVNDEGAPMEASPDPLLGQLQGHLRGVRAGDPSSLADQLRLLLSNPALFGVDLYTTALGKKVEDMFREMLEGPGAVRKTLQKYLS